MLQEKDDMGLMKQHRTSLVIGNTILLVLVLTIYFVCILRHIRNPMDHTRQIQTLFLRVDIMFLVYSILFYMRLIWIEDMELYEPIEQFIFPLLEGIVIFSFFNLMVLLVGGTMVAKELIENIPNGQIGRISCTKNLDSFRGRLIMFLFIRPILGVIDGWAVNKYITNPSIRAYRFIHIGVSAASVFIMVIAFIGVLRTYRAVKTEISESFNLTSKFIVIKAMLLITTLQWFLANAIVGEWSHMELYIYSTVCMGETLILSILFYLYFPSTELNVPMLHGSSEIFQFRNAFAVWDLFQYPIAIEQSTYKE